MNRTILALLLAGLAATATPASAQQYRWIDEKGRVQYTDTPPPKSAKDVRRLSGAAKPAATPSGTPAPSAELARLQEQSPVVLYTHPSCTEACDLARGVLNRRGVPFREVSVTTNAAIDELKTKSGASNVPVLMVGSRIEATVLEQAYDAALDAGGYPKAGILPARSQAAPPPPKPEEVQTQAAGEKKPAPAPVAEPAPVGPYAPGATPPKPAPKPAP